jgi:single-stranded DNA-binding protein
MSLHALASGTLTAQPQHREGTKGPFTTATIRAADGDEPIFVSVIAFGENGERLLGFAKGDALAVSGKAKLTSWVGRDGTERHGISVAVDQIATAKPRPKQSARGAPGARRKRSHSVPQPGSNPGTRFHNDSVDDLWRDVP